MVAQVSRGVAEAVETAYSVSYGEHYSGAVRSLADIGNLLQASGFMKSFMPLVVESGSGSEGRPVLPSPLTKSLMIISFNHVTP